AIWRALPLTARADDGSFTTMVTDPPPADITWQGQRYFLAHLNAYRVIYSPRPPPAEPSDGRQPFDPDTRLRVGCMSGSCCPDPALLSSSLSEEDADGCARRGPLLYRAARVHGRTCPDHRR